MVGCCWLYFGGLGCTRALRWVDANSDGLVVLEQRVTAGVDARMRGYPGVYQERGRRGGQPKNVRHVCDGNNLQMQRGGFFVSARSTGIRGALPSRGAGVGRDVRRNVDLGKAVPGVACLCRQVVIWET